ncbi:MAG TPA: hydroxymethylglutaryl-CoA lyase [Chloroflexi bacterium]|nr:hydroxymethylglutaryl-CoA lyase [Chloroflexota bacterium]
MTRNGWFSSLPSTVEMVEVGPRDGLQIVQEFVPTERKIELIDALFASGIRRMEVTSFVHPKFVPQLRDAADVLAGIKREGRICMAMVPNMRGAEGAVEARVDMLDVIVSASESHNRSNVRRSIDESLEGFVPIFELARQAGVSVRASLATSFGCPFEGDVPVSQVLRVCHRLHELGVMEIALCDTTGMANPVQVSKVVGACVDEIPDLQWAAHFHNTRGAGSANLLAALMEGITIFDASIAGLGGCPFAPGATGNVPTEDMVHMLHEMGIDTGIDLPALVSTALLAEEIIGETLPGQVMKAGRTCDLHPLPVLEES